MPKLLSLFSKITWGCRMDGFKRPTRPQQPPRPTQAPPVSPNNAAPNTVPAAIDAPIDMSLPEERVDQKEKRSILAKFYRIPKWVRIVCISSFIVLAVAGIGLYTFLLSPRDASATNTIPVEIVSGMIPGQIAEKLEEKGIIRSSLAFSIHTRLRGKQLQAGNYELSPAKSAPDIATELQGGTEADEIEVMFKPGATLADNKKVLMALGYDAGEIDAAFRAEYDHPLFEGRPAGSDLEGYIFGETHRFTTGTSVKAILSRYFDDYYAVIQENNLVNGYESQGLSLFEGITLASIVQRESGGDDKPGIAQVFLLRLSIGMQLGSDVTYQYIADKEGNPRDVNYDSAYNTRRYAGLPPGPIASPGTAALKAVANPADGDYMYFLSGDDDVTYFARTSAEHEANIRNHCQEKCKII